MNDCIVEAAALSDVGLKRDHNEDAHLVVDLARSGPFHGTITTNLARRSGALLVVADGMGGANAGEVASRMAVDLLRDQVRDLLQKAGTVSGLAEGFLDATRHVNGEIFRKAKSDKSLRGMGTTLTAALVSGDVLLIAQVGDSRAYLLRKNELTQVTRDQSLVGQMIYEGKMSAEDARAKLPKNVILQAVGKKETLEPVLTALELRRGDALLLCSDGLSNLVKDEEMVELARTVSDRDKTCEVLVDLAKKRGGDDNITVVLAGFRGEGLTEAADGTIPLYEDLLAERGEEKLGGAEEEELGDRTMVNPSAVKTMKLPPRPEEPETKEAPFQFDVDAVLGSSESPTAEPPLAATVPVAPTQAEPSAADPYPVAQNAESLDPFESLFQSDGAPSPAESASPAATDRKPVLPIEPVAKPPSPPAATPVVREHKATPADRFVKTHKEAVDPWGGSDTEAIQNVQASLDDSDLFKRDEVLKAPKRSAAPRLLLAMGIVAILAAGGLYLSRSSNGGRTSPAPTVRPSSAPSPPSPAPSGHNASPAATKATRRPRSTPDESQAGTPPPTHETTPPEATPDPAATTGKAGLLHLATDPPGAYVRLNGIIKGVTPLDLSIPMGPRQNLLVHKVGFTDFHRSDFVMRKAEDKLDLKLTAKD